MNPHLQPLISDYLYGGVSAEKTARDMLKLHGKKYSQYRGGAIRSILWDAAMGTEPPCRDEVIEALEREISNAEPRRRV